jgi:prepilin-type N-terminal cleavage/methylation domain-containing protein
MRAWTPVVETNRGMTLVEVIIATALFTVVTLAAAHLLVWASRALWGTGAQTLALAAAQARLEQLQSLAWYFDANGNRVSDLDTDLSSEAISGGGPGLSPSPANALTESLDGYADYLDDEGRWVGRGTQTPPGAAYVRRWAVRPFDGSADDTLVFQVLVAPLANKANSRQQMSGSAAGESLLTTARTRVR